MSKERMVETYVLCVDEPREFEKLRAVASSKFEGAECVTAIPVRYLTEHTALVLAFFVGNGNIKNERGEQVERKPIFSGPIMSAKHWLPGDRGRFGALRIADFLTQCAKSNKEAANKEGHASNVSVRHYNDELALVYG